MPYTSPSWDASINNMGCTTEVTEHDCDTSLHVKWSEVKWSANKVNTERAEPSCCYSASLAIDSWSLGIRRRGPWACNTSSCKPSDRRPSISMHSHIIIICKALHRLANSNGIESGIVQHQSLGSLFYLLQLITGCLNVSDFVCS